MTYTNDSYATMLLCCHMSATRQELFEPLTPHEFFALKKKLRQIKKPLSWLLNSDVVQMMRELQIAEKEAHRLIVLIERMVTLTYELDDYSSHGISVITASDKQYPRILSERLGAYAPPILYAAGNMNLFNKPVLSIVGSVPGDEASEAETIRLTDLSCSAGFVIANGGTGGLDRTSETRVCDNGGGLITWLPGGMNEAIKRDLLSYMISDKRAAAISIVHPDAPVQSAYAKARSKCLYASGVASYVLGCEFMRGDTWEGAAEALKNGYSNRVFCWDTQKFSGNAALIARGAEAVKSADQIDFDILYAKFVRDNGEQTSMFDDRSLF